MNHPKTSTPNTRAHGSPRWRLRLAGWSLVLLAGAATAAGPMDFLFSGTGEIPRDAMRGPAEAWKFAEFSAVRLTPRESGSPSNGQPATLDPERLRVVLATIQFVEADGDTTPLFHANELQDLVPALVSAFAASGPEQDLLVVSTSRRGDGPVVPPRSAVLRTFVADGRLQVIVQTTRADYYGPFRAARMVPNLRFGSRQADSGVKLRSAAAVARRGDWLALDIAPRPASAAEPGAALPPVAPTPAAAATPAPAPVQARPATRDRAFYEQQELRLQQLKRLHEQGLLSDSEYQQKRREIIDSL